MEKDFLTGEERHHLGFRNGSLPLVDNKKLSIDTSTGLYFIEVGGFWLMKNIEIENKAELEFLYKTLTRKKLSDHIKKVLEIEEKNT